MSASAYEFQKKFKIRFFLLFLLGVGVFFVALTSSVFANQSSSTVKKLEISPPPPLVSDVPPVVENFRKEQQQKQAEREAQKKAQEAAKKVQEDIQQVEKMVGETGIGVTTDCLVNGGCSFSIYDALDIRKDRATGERTSVMTFLNDIILGLTWFIGTVVTVAFLLSGFYYIISPVESGAKKKASEGMKYALIGMVVVSLSVVIVRLVQFLARGGT